MTLLYALFFGAGVAGMAYSYMGRRVGYGNSQNVAMVVGVIFVIASIFFWTVLKFIVGI